MRKKVEQENTRRKDAKKMQLKDEGKKKPAIKLSNKQIIALIVIVVIVILVIAINNYTSLGLVLNKNITSKDVVQVELQTSNNKIIPFGNEILVYNDGMITTYNNYGKQTGEIILEDTMEAEILTAGNYIQVINKDKGLVYVYKNKYEVARLKIDGVIYSGSINSEGTSVIEYSSNGNKTELGIYNNKGEKKYNVKLSNDIIGKYVLSENSKYLVYVDVNIKGISARTSVNFIDLSNIKEDEANIKMLHTEDNSLSFDIYWTGNSVVARFEESYMIYNVILDKKEIISIAAGQIADIGDYDKRCAYTNLDETGKYVLNIKKMKSNSVKRITLDDVPKYFKYENGIAYVCYAKKIEAYNNSGAKIKHYDSAMVITEPVIFNNGRSVAMAISNKLMMFTI